MTSNYQYIRQLYLENLTGTISSEDYNRLQTLLETDPEVRTIWLHLEGEGEKLQIQSRLEAVEPENELLFLKDKIDYTNNKLLWKPLLWAATLAFAVGLSWYFFPERSNTLSGNQNKGKNVIERKTGISLTTPDGNAVSLAADGTQSMTVDGVHLDSKNGVLTYSGDARETALSELYIPAKQSYEIVLSDGTKVSLNSETKLKFPLQFAGITREVYVDGEAFFDVKKDEKRPFIVHTGLADIVVTGTSFNINTYDAKRMKTALVEGKVQVRAGEKRPVDLLPGFEITANDDKSISTSRFDPDEVLSWRTGQYFFHNESLEQLGSFIMRWYDLEVVFDNQALKKHMVSGLLEKDNLNEFLIDLKTTTGIDHRIEGRKLHLK